MRIPPVSISSAFVRSMPAIDPSARVEKRTAPEGVGRQRALGQASRKSAYSIKGRTRTSPRRASWDGLGQEVDVRV
jgi:hypothetical protein